MCEFVLAPVAQVNGGVCYPEPYFRRPHQICATIDTRGRKEADFA